MLTAKGLTFSYQNGKEISYPDFTCEAGESKLILGQSGCGKTTLLQLLGGLRRPDNGEVIIDGVDVHQLSASELDSFRGKKIGFIFQQPHFMESLTVMENLRVAQVTAGYHKDDDRIDTILNRLGIANKASKKPSSLSQGEQQRVAIARALINNPRLILADEPTSALDDINTAEVLSLIEEESKKVNAALLIVTHDTRLKDQFENRVHL